MSLLTEALNYMYYSARRGISVPRNFHSRVKKCKEMLDNDYSSLVTVNFDFAVNVSLVDYKIETNNSNLTRDLNKWKRNINSTFEGKIPSGLRNLVKEYLKERWTSSLIVMNVVWGQVGKYILPTKIWFMDAYGITVDGDSSKVGSFQYLVKTDEGKRELPLNKDSDILVQKPFARLYDKYPSPFLVRRGTLASWMMKKVLKEKSSEILDEIIPYMFIMKKGSPELFKQGTDYGDPELKELMRRVKEHIKKQKEKATSETGMFATTFDTDISEFIPDLKRMFDRKIYEEIDRDILSSLGLIEIIEGIGTSRKEAILNPKPFIREIYSAINDFASLMEDLMVMIVEKNLPNHRKLFSENTNIKIKPGTPHIGLVELLVHFRSLYDRGLLSKKTYLDLVEQDIDTEVDRRDVEADEGIDEKLYPPVIQNLEQNPYVEDFPETVPEDRKKGKPETKNFKSALQALENAECPYCGEIFDYESQPEAGMGWVKCPNPKCEKAVTQKELLSKIKIGVGCRTCDEVFEVMGIESGGTVFCPYCGEINDVDDLITAPYTLQTLPSGVKKLPAHAQRIWMNAFNASYKKWGETRAFKIAWGAVKRMYKKVGNKWVKRVTKADLETASVDDLLNLKIKEKQLKLLNKLTEDKEEK